MARRPLMMGNWKMNLGLDEAMALARALAEGWSAPEDAPEAVLCPSFLHLRGVVEIVAGTPFAVGGQDCVHQEPGACTGGTSAEQLRDCGATWVILGHSERRAYFGETDEALALKLAAARRVGLAPVLCVGETLADREAGRTAEVVSSQLRGALASASAEELSALTIAYEPVWAIGTGRNAEIEDVRQVHRLVRERLAELAGDAVAQAVRILYGGSVNEKNAAAYMALEDVDGALVGGASLDAERFLAILEAGRSG